MPRPNPIGRRRCTVRTPSSGTIGRPPADAAVGWSAPARWIARLLGLVLAAAVGLVLPWTGGCASPDPLQPPQVLISPYASLPAEPVVAVVPLRNESGTSAVDALGLSDTLVSTVTQVRGLRALPMNRTLAAMRALEMDQPQSPEDLDRLARMLGADAVIVGSITAYDPYEPIVGLALALHARPGALHGARPAAIEIDPRLLREQPTEYDYFAGQRDAGQGPASSVMLVLDGRDHDVQMRVRRFAQGRAEAVSALGWRRYLRSMPEFERFAAHEALGQLLQREWVRLARVSVRDGSASPGG